MLRLGDNPAETCCSHFLMFAFNGAMYWVLQPWGPSSPSRSVYHYRPSVVCGTVVDRRRVNVSPVANATSGTKYHITSHLHCPIEFSAVIWRLVFSIIPSVSVCRTDLVALDHLLDIFARRFLCFNSITFCFSYSYMRQTKLASSLLNFWAHENIVIDWLTDYGTPLWV